jgi:uncharacterized membrane protein (UPF0127 family)
MTPNSSAPVNRFAKFLLKKIAPVWVFFFLMPVAPAQEGAQPRLPVVELRVGGKAVDAEVADEEHERAAGLMFREKLGGDEGMLFVMPRPGPAGFWMRNTVLPLTIAYLDEKGTILELHDLEPRNEKVVRSAFPNIAYALEMPQGWFTENNVWPGERVAGLPKPTGR